LVWELIFNIESSYHIHIEDDMLTSLYFFLYFRPKGAIEFIGIDFFEFNKGIFFDFFFEISCGKKVVTFPLGGREVAEMEKVRGIL
jgi:hypothetical protein